jgi:predicted RNA-binding protein Jag
MILDFIAEKNEEKLSLHNLNSYQRKIIHELCEKYNISHVSSLGTNKIKSIVITKILKKEEEPIKVEE